jgi:hypothetical protein
MNILPPRSPTVTGGEIDKIGVIIGVVILDGYECPWSAAIMEK